MFYLLYTIFKSFHSKKLHIFGFLASIVVIRSLVIFFFVLSGWATYHFCKRSFPWRLNNSMNCICTHRIKEVQENNSDQVPSWWHCDRTTFQPIACGCTCEPCHWPCTDEIMKEELTIFKNERWTSKFPTVSDFPSCVLVNFLQMKIVGIHSEW